MNWITQNWVTIFAVATTVGTLGGIAEKSKTPWVARVGGFAASAALDLVGVGKALGLVKP